MKRDLRSHWRDMAACRDADADLFFPPNEPEGDIAREIREQAARAICACCPVIGPCLDLALATSDVWSISGAMNHAERLLFKRRNRSRKTNPDRSAA